MEGFPSRISKGWDQELEMNPGLLSSDPDDPTDMKFNFTWYCRVVAPDLEEYKHLDHEDFPIESEYNGMRIPNPAEREPNLIAPRAGCFGTGPGKIASRSGKLKLNTKSFETYSQIYEVMVVISKGDRRAKAKVEIEIGSIPSPVMSIKCKSKSLCFPGYGGVFVNPTTRLAITAECIGLCEGDLTYEWNLSNEYYNITTVSHSTSTETIIYTIFFCRLIAYQLTIPLS